MLQAPDISISHRSVSLLGTIIITGTVVFSTVGLQGTLGQNAVLDIFPQKVRANLGVSDAKKSIASNSSTYLIGETNIEGSYLHFDRRELGSIINIIADYPSLEKIANDQQICNNLPKTSMYEILLNSGIININQCLKESFNVGSAYATSGFTVLESPYSPSILTLDEIEVIAMTQEVRDLSARLNSIDDKYDKKIEGISDRLWQELKDISGTLKNIDGRLGIVETKFSGMKTNISKIENRTTNFRLYVLLPLITTALGGVIAVVATKLLGY